jgi:hypothetical protein
MGTDWKGKIAGYLVMVSGVAKIFFPGKSESIDTMGEGLMTSLDGIVVFIIGFGMWAIRQAMGPSKHVKK